MRGLRSMILAETPHPQPFTRRDSHRSISSGASFSTEWGRWPGGPDGVRKAGMIRQRFTMTVAQSDLV